MSATRLTIDGILTSFFDAERAEKKGVTRRRIDLAERLLREYLEVRGERVLVAADAILLAREREFEPEGAFVRTMHADDLVFALPGFLNEVTDLEPLDRRVQLRMADRLLGSLLARRLVNRDAVICPLLDARCAIDSGRAQLRHPSLREV